MASTVRNIAEELRVYPDSRTGELTTSTVAIYDPAPSTYAEIEAITMTNYSAADVTVNLLLNKGGVSTELISPDFTIAAGETMIFHGEIDGAYPVYDGDSIDADCSSNSAVRYAVAMRVRKLL